MAVDLHIHTTASDGSWPSPRVVEAAIELGLTHIAITDHDSVEGVAAAERAAAGTPLEVIPGVELSVLGPAGEDIHLLGFMIDPASPSLLAILSDLRDQRFARARTMVRRLAEAGHPITLDQVAAQADGGAVGRVHIARALVESGSVDTIERAFAEFIGRRGPFYVGKTTLAPTDAIAAVHRAGGVAVLAHPGISGASALDGLVAAGLDGLEAFHAEHTSSQREEFSALAAARGLVATGGSDFHGPGSHNGMLGSGACPPSAIGALRERARLLHP